MSDLPQKPPFEHTELYADLIHAYHHRLAHEDAKAQVKAMFLNRDAPDFRTLRDALYAGTEAAKDAISSEYLRRIEEVREKYDRGEL